jgi:hypothetical protein
VVSSGNLRHRAATTLATLTSTRFPLHLLRRYLHTRPGARRVLVRTASFGGASWISLSLSTPIKIRDSSTMAAPQDDDEMRGRTQQAPLASQRAKDQAQSQQGRVAKWFPLGAKEGFSQWVGRRRSNRHAAC